MASTSVEMKVERSLLDANFEGYKLSLDCIPSYKADFENSLAAKSLSEEQFSFFHAKLFASQNVLIQDEKVDGKCGVYLLDGQRVCHVIEKNGHCAEINQVWKSDSEVFSDRSYNTSLSFPSSNLAVFSDGNGMLHILETGERGTHSIEPWKCVYKNEVSGPNRPFIIRSSLLVGEMTLYILIQYVEEKDKIEGWKAEIGQKAPNFVNVAEWITFTVRHDEKVELDRIKRFAFIGEIEHLELSKEMLLFFGEEKPFQIVYDSAGGTIEEEMENLEQKNGKANGKGLPPFFWYQGVEDMAIWVSLPEKINKKEIKVSLKPSHMTVRIKDETIFDGKLWNVLDSDSMTWTIDSKKHRLEITVCKANVGLVWQRFLANDTDGEEVMDPVMVDKIHEELAHLSTENPMPDPNENSSQVFNNQELEDCDENAEVSRAFILIKSTGRLDASQKVNVGDRQFLFKAPSLEMGSPNVLCLRHDVDGLVWQPTIDDTARLKFDHVDTFNAFGYVQASKNQRRFVVSSPDRSYVSIIDRIKHVYVYKKPEPISAGCELRNRKSGQHVQKVAKQQVPTIDHDAEDFVVGALATNETLFISTKKALFCLKVSSQ